MHDPLAARFADLVQIRRADQSSFGSGRIVGENLVLTARHVVSAVPDAAGTVATVYRWPDLRARKVAPIAAKVVWSAAADEFGRHADLALLRLAPKGKAVTPELPLGFGICPPDATGAWTSGFPWLIPEAEQALDGAAEGVLPGGIDEFNLPGKCFAVKQSEPTLSFEAAIGIGRADEAAQDAASRWCGLSGGAAVIGDRIVGVMRSQDKWFDAGTVLSAASLAAVAKDRAFIDLLPDALRPPWPLAAPRAPLLPLPVEVQGLSFVLETLDRTIELGLLAEAIKAHRPGAALEIVLYAQSDDLPEKFFLAACEGGPLSKALNHDLPPLEIIWPDGAANAQAIAADLAQRAGRALDQYGVGDWTALQALLANANPAPWMYLMLPPRLTAADADALAGWRGCWAGAAAERRDLCGYLLSFGAEARHWRMLESARKRKLAGLQRVPDIALQPVALADLVAWPNNLRSQRHKKPELKPYIALAEQLVPQIRVRNWVRFQPYDLQRVMTGAAGI